METILQERQIDFFEKKVLENLLIDSSVFDVCVHAHRGYTFILRNWIKDAFLNGNTPDEVASAIKNSALPIDELIKGRPLHLTNIITQLPQTSVSTVFS